MRTNTTQFSLAEYCAQIESRQIIVNPNYQRTDKVWPVAARSFLIDTILSDYPLPKISLAQKTDLKSRRTYKEVVDGQQRTAAIVDYFNDKYALTRGSFSGRKFSTLDPDDQNKFLQYPISCDVLVGASDDDIREVFRRINSYTIPLNHQEKRHATFQGPFKWMISRLSKRYGSAFKEMGVFNERQLSRMNDAELLTEMAQIIISGIQDGQQQRLDNLYKQYDAEFTDESMVEHAIDTALGLMIEMKQVHKTALTARYNTYSLFAAIAGAQLRPANLEQIFSFEGQEPLSDPDIVSYNLSMLAESLDSEEGAEFSEYRLACSKGTNRKKQRETRHKWLCRALLPEQIHE